MNNIIYLRITEATRTSKVFFFFNPEKQSRMQHHIHLKPLGPVELLKEWLFAADEWLSTTVQLIHFCPLAAQLAI